MFNLLIIKLLFKRLYTIIKGANLIDLPPP